MTNTASAQLAEMLAPSMRSTLAAKGYLARYTGQTLRSYEISMRLFFRFMLSYRIDPLEALRPHIELFMRVHLEEERGCQPSSVHHHMSVVRGFYKFALMDEHIAKDPTLGVLLPKIWIDEWRTDWVTGKELAAMILAAEQSDRPSDRGLIALLAIAGLRIDECLRAQIGDFDDVVLGHRVLRLIGKGSKPATMPLPVSVARMLDYAAAGRTSGPLLIRDGPLLRRDYRGQPMSYTAARGAIDRLAAAAGIERRLTPHMFRRGVITAGLNNGIPIREMQILARHSDSRTSSRYDRGVQNLDGHAIHELARRLASG